MLIWIDGNREIKAYNSAISKVDAQSYIANGAIWFDNIVFPTTKDGETLILKEDNTITIEIKEEILSERESRSLDRDEMAVQQLLLLLDIQLNTSI